MQLILASKSPRRKQLLQDQGFDFTVVVGNYKEKIFCSDPVKTACTFAQGKAEDVYYSLNEISDVIVLGADTVVYSDKKILGKPKTDEEAFTMIKSLSGKTHTVITGYCVINKDENKVGYEQSMVTFNELTDDDIKKYVQSGQYKGKAGGYGIQDPYLLVKSYEGSLSNVIGLPVEKITPILKKLLKK